MQTILMISREYGGIAEAGGVKDVVTGLSRALVKKGMEVFVVIPCYGFVFLKGLEPLPWRISISMHYAAEERYEEVGFRLLVRDGVYVVLVEADRFAEKHGVYTYTAEEEANEPWKRKGEGHFDYFAMNVLLQKAALSFCVLKGIKPNVIHCHDGHTALTPAMARILTGFAPYFLNTRFAVTIHNAGLGYHQEVADIPFARAITELPNRLISSSVLNGAFDPLLACADYAALNTVSPNYARELQETDLDAMTGWLGHMLKARGVTIKGITNGIEPDSFDSRRPEMLYLPAAFDVLSGDLSGKRAARQRLLEVIAMSEVSKVRVHGALNDVPEAPLLTMVSRLTEQKGIHVLIPALNRLFDEDRGVQCVVMGSGKEEFEKELAQLAWRNEYAGRMAVCLGFDQALANLVYAAGDFFLIPSSYEPCGLTDFMAQLMGNLPIVRATGGLVKVLDGVTGFSYAEHTPDALLEAVHRALHVFRTDRAGLVKMQKHAVRHIYDHYTWEKVAEEYQGFYETITV
ncbi:MAG: glycogen/starch synthase [Dissulfuribacterales bacterium]